MRSDAVASVLPTCLLIAVASLGLAGCAAPSPAPQSEAAPGLPGYNTDYVPDFATKPYERLTREDVVGIALREWRLFGQGVDDDPPDSKPPLPAELKPERWPGMWERVGEYWWIGMNPTSSARDWTGKHDAYGVVFGASDDGEYAWSAAFISYVMRIAGAGTRFPYSQSHSTYINAAVRAAQSGNDPWVIVAQPPDGYAPKRGDIICTGRGSAARLRYRDLPHGGFPAHCDFVVDIKPGELSVIGGNLDDAVTMKHIPVTADGLLAPPGGTVLDYRYNWCVVLQVLYDQETDTVAMN
ncbi:MAG TPA: DUF2272 domain-containing protein [Acetobacteraceae bacterium]|jgi:hypothetical protein|nr:DUF2272 domain-containing protein [Acetobacteraceae bacterium]